MLTSWPPFCWTVTSSLLAPLSPSVFVYRVYSMDLAAAEPVLPVLPCCWGEGRREIGARFSCLSSPNRWTAVKAPNFKTKVEQNPDLVKKIRIRSRNSASGQKDPDPVKKDLHPSPGSDSTTVFCAYQHNCGSYSSNLRLFRNRTKPTFINLL